MQVDDNHHIPNELLANIWNPLSLTLFLSESRGDQEQATGTSHLPTNEAKREESVMSGGWMQSQVLSEYNDPRNDLKRLFADSLLLDEGSVRHGHIRVTRPG